METRHTSLTLPGIHHITAIAGDPQRNVDFYIDALGLRLVKRTVNFDAPDVYHLYYGDDLGRPGTVLTFFPFPGAARGRVGAGQVSATAFSIPAASADYWTARLAKHGIESGAETRFGEPVITLADPDGMPIELIAHAGTDPRAGWADGPVPATHAIRGFHGATLLVAEPGPTVALLTEALGFDYLGSENRRGRYAARDGGHAPGTLVDVLEAPRGSRGVQGAGTVHHIAYRTPDDAEQAAWRAELLRQGLNVTEVRDREYFHSIYFHEPGGILYEIATDQPGFGVDESPERLGTGLKLPPWYEGRRAQLERALAPLNVPAANNRALAREGQS